MRRRVNRQVLEKRAENTIEERKRLSAQEAYPGEESSVGTFTITEEEDRSAKATMERLIRRMLEFMISFFGGKADFYRIVRKATGMNDRELAYFGINPELCDEYKGNKKKNSEKKVTPGRTSEAIQSNIQLSIWDYDTSWNIKDDVKLRASRNLGSYYAHVNVEWKIVSPEVKRLRDVLNHMRNYMKSVMGTVAWNDVQLEALGLTVRKFVTRYDKYKDLGIVLGGKYIKEYEKARELAESKLAPRNNSFFPYFFEQARPWNKEVELEDMTQGLSISKKTENQINLFARYNYQRWSDGYWFDEDKKYVQLSRKSLVSLDPVKLQ